MSFRDHFSAVASHYAAARPEYPDALFEALAEAAPRGARVWEPGCGSGQATRGLAARFAHVHATDPSAQQIARHWARQGAGNVTLAVEPGERTALADGAVGLVAVAQALHWFDLDAFFAECARVLAPGGVLAACWRRGAMPISSRHRAWRTPSPHSAPTSSPTGRRSARWSTRTTPDSRGRSRRCPRPRSG